MMRLTILSVAFPFAAITADPVGGAEQVLAHIDRALVAAGHHSIVVAAEGSRPAGELVSLPQPRGAIGSSEWASMHVLLRRVISNVAVASAADLVHMHGLDYHSYLPPPGVPVLATLHMPLACYTDYALNPQRPRTWLNTVSRHQRTGAGLRERFVGAIENGVKPALARPARRKRPYVLALGRICREKGFHLAIDAAKSAGVALRLAGQVFPFPEHQRYFAEEIQPRLDGSRRWIGPVSGARKWRLLRDAQCLLAPSLVPETASLVAREALAAGTPVVAFPNGALAETVETGRTGFLVDTVEDMARAIGRCGEIAPNTCQQVARERFSANRMISEYLHLYARLAQG